MDCKQAKKSDITMNNANFLPVHGFRNLAGIELDSSWIIVSMLFWDHKNEKKTIIFSAFLAVGCTAPTMGLPAEHLQPVGSGTGIRVRCPRRRLRNRSVPTTAATAPVVVMPRPSRWHSACWSCSSSAFCWWPLCPISMSKCATSASAETAAEMEEQMGWMLQHNPSKMFKQYRPRTMTRCRLGKKPPQLKRQRQQRP